jgi:hypothetical protein
MAFLENDMLTLRTYKFQKAHNFEAVLPIVGIADPIKVSRLVQAVNYTDYEMSGVNGMRYGAFQAYFAGFMTKRSFTISFIETEDQDVKRYLNAWRNLIVDGRGLFKRKKGFLFGYAKPIVLVYTDNNSNPTNVVTFNNAFPVEFTPWTVDYTQSGIQKIQATFVCDSIDEIRDIISSPIEDLVTKIVPDF